MGALISTLVKIVIGWLFIDRVPTWLNLKGFIAFIVKLIGILIILSALLDWI